MASPALILDRNKSELTHKVTAAVHNYLDERGFKPLETEVPICDGWVADLAGVISPTQTELQGLKLLPSKPHWKNNNEDIEAWYALAKQRQRLMTCLVEVKTSISDFRSDRKWNWPSDKFPVNLAYLAIPNTLPIERRDFPLSWGVLEYSETRNSIRCIQVPEIWTVPIEQHLSVILDVGIRCDHRVRYAGIREQRKQEAIYRNEDVSRTRMSNAIRAVMAVVSGHSWNGKLPHVSVEDALLHHGIKHVSAMDMEYLHKLWKTVSV